LGSTEVGFILATGGAVSLVYWGSQLSAATGGLMAAAVVALAAVGGIAANRLLASPHVEGALTRVGLTLAGIGWRAKALPTYTGLWLCHGAVLGLIAVVDRRPQPGPAVIRTSIM
jgi:hypothetical protein